MYTLVFYAIDAPATWFASARAEAAAAVDQLAETFSQRKYDPADYTLLGFKPGDDDPLVELAPIPLALLAFQGFALLGSLVFRNAPALKTLLVGFLVLVALVALDGVLDMDSDGFFEYWSHVERYSGFRAITLPLAWFAVPALLWVGAFVALREREVA